MMAMVEIDSQGRTTATSINQAINATQRKQQQQCGGVVVVLIGVAQGASRAVACW